MAGFAVLAVATVDIECHGYRTSCPLLPDKFDFINKLLINIWRRGWDLNPRYPLRYVRFRGGSFQPLTHLSGEQLSAIRRQRKATANDQRLTAVFKERLQHLRRTSGEHPG